MYAPVGCEPWATVHRVKQVELGACLDRADARTQFIKNRPVAHSRTTRINPRTYTRLNNDPTN